MLSYEIYWLLCFVVFCIPLSVPVVVLNLLLAYNLCLIKFIETSPVDLDLLFILIFVGDGAILLMGLMVLATKRQQVLYCLVWLSLHISNYQILFIALPALQAVDPEHTFVVWLQEFFYLSDRFTMDGLVGTIQMLLQRESKIVGTTMAFVIILFAISARI